MSYRFRKIRRAQIFFCFSSTIKNDHFFSSLLFPFLLSSLFPLRKGTFKYLLNAIVSPKFKFFIQTSMPFCLSSVVTYPCRVCRKFRVLARFSTSCALNTVDYFKEIDTHVSNYPELRRRMQSYAISGDFSNAFSTLNLMKNIDGKPTVYDCNALMYFYLKSKNACWQELVEMYTGMKRFGPPPVASTFNTLLNGMLLLGDLKHAIFIVEEMYRNHFVPSFTSLSKTLKMAVKVGNLLDGLLVSELMLSGRGKVLAFGSIDFIMKFKQKASAASAFKSVLGKAAEQ
ncbi:uncharacterized protein LOC108470666 [Gossypium arboreum]|uniref:uncharacterized protein LOC108470666 n=1 Tax=Gossypium arboreum TaxID=29729 RepID=UPI0022F16601|nr:uncharacterized protein LOC108470666 [Gossypium arboreum]